MASAGTNSSTPSPLLGLPIEIMQHIATYAWSPWQDTKVNGSLGLRSVCREIRSKTLYPFGEMFFRDLTLAFTQESLDRLTRIATHRHNTGFSLAKFVRKLSITTHRVASLEEIEKLRTLHPGKNLFGPSGPIWEFLERAVTSDAYPSHIIKEAKRYREALRQQQALEASRGDMKLLSKALLAFPNLSSLEVVTSLPDSWWGRERMEPNLDDMTQYDYEMRDRTELTTSFTKVVRAIAVLDVYPNAHFSLDRLAVHTYDWSSGTGSCPHALELHELLLPHIGTVWTRIVSNLTELRLSIDMSGHEGLAVDTATARDSFRALLSSDNLRVLQVQFHYRWKTLHLPDATQPKGVLHQYIVALTERKRFPKLRELTLDCESALLPAEAAPIIAKHGAKLRKLEIVTCIFGHNDGAQQAGNADWLVVWQTVRTCEELEDFDCYVVSDVLALARINVKWQTRADLQEGLDGLIASLDEADDESEGDESEGET